MVHLVRGAVELFGGAFGRCPRPVYGCCFSGFARTWVARRRWFPHGHATGSHDVLRLIRAGAGFSGFVCSGSAISRRLIPAVSRELEGYRGRRNAPRVVESAPKHGKKQVPFHQQFTELYAYMAASILYSDDVCRVAPHPRDRRSSPAPPVHRRDCRRRTPRACSRCGSQNVEITSPGSLLMMTMKSGAKDFRVPRPSPSS